MLQTYAMTDEERSRFTRTLLLIKVASGCSGVSAGYGADPLNRTVVRTETNINLVGTIHACSVCVLHMRSVSAAGLESMLAD
jgi:hypothetical protein